MVKFGKKLALALLALSFMSEAQAGNRIRYAYRPSYVPNYTTPYYGVPSGVFAPAVASVPTAMPGAVTVSSGHTLVPRAYYANGSPSLYEVHQPGWGFTGWLQAIVGGWQYVQSVGQGGGGGVVGGGNQTLTQVKTQVDSTKTALDAHIAKYDKDIAEIKARFPGAVVTTPPVTAAPAAGSSDPLDKIDATLKALPLRN